MEDLIKRKPFRILMFAIALLGAVALAAGAVLRHRGWGEYEYVVMAGGGLLIVFSLFLFAIFPYHAKNDNMAKNMRLEPIWDFSMKMTGWALSACLLFVIFRVEHLAVQRTLMVLSAICLIATIGCWIYYIVQKKQFGNR